MMGNIFLWLLFFIIFAVECYFAIKKGIKLKKEDEVLSLVFEPVYGNLKLKIIVKFVVSIVSLGILIQYIVKAIQS